MNTRVCTQARQPVSRASGDRARPGQACVRMPGDPGRGDGPGLGLSVCVPAVWPWGTPSLGHCVCVCVCACAQVKTKSTAWRAELTIPEPPLQSQGDTHFTRQSQGPGYRLWRWPQGWATAASSRTPGARAGGHHGPAIRQWCWGAAAIKAPWPAPAHCQAVPGLPCPLPA